MYGLLFEPRHLLVGVVAFEQLEQPAESFGPLLPCAGGNAHRGVALSNHGATNRLGNRASIAHGELTRREARLIIQ